MTPTHHEPIWTEIAPEDVVTWLGHEEVVEVEATDKTLVLERTMGDRLRISILEMPDGDSGPLLRFETGDPLPPPPGTRTIAPEGT
jgi:hypothetical protein